MFKRNRISRSVDVAGVTEVAKVAAEEAAFAPPGVMNTLQR
jgi:hypothetical protein